MDGGQIEKLIDTAMSNMKTMVDVNTIVGDTVETVDGTVIVPISRVNFGFAVGGGNLKLEKEDRKEEEPFAGGSGAGVSLNPMAFLVVSEDQVRLLPVSKNAVTERLVNTAPEVLKEINKIISGRKNIDERL